jgi:hypothetical protein
MARVTPQLSIVIVHYETPDLLRACLRSLADDAPPCASHEVLVIDNSRDATAAAAVCADFPAVRLLHPGRNTGFAGGVNHGLHASEGRYVLVLNPDVVAHPGAVDALVAFMDAHPDAGIAGARLLNTDGSLQYSCRRFYTLGAILLRRTPLGRLFPRHRVAREHLYADWDHAAVRDVDWVIGASMMVRREAVDEVGPADERFFLYFEDVDWCYRMHQHGWRVAYVPSAVMTHHHRRESARGVLGRGSRLHVVSSVRFYEKWSLLLYVLKKNAGAVRTAALLCADAFAAVVAYFVAYETRSVAAAVFTKPLYPLGSYTSFLVVAAIASLLVFAGSGLYSVQRLSDRALFRRTARASLVVGVVLMALTFIVSVKVSRVIVAVFVPALAVAATGSRLLLARLVRRAALNGVDVRRVLTVGGSEAATRVIEALREQRARGYAHAGHVDVHAPRYPGHSPDAQLRRILRAARAGRVGAVVFVEPLPGDALVVRLRESLAGMGVALLLAPSWGSWLDTHARIEEMAGQSLIALGRARARAPRASGERDGADTHASADNLPRGLEDTR